MKAIVQTCDRWHRVADFMIGRYQELWPGNPFTFRVPYQEGTIDRPNVEMVRTPLPFKDTVLTLIADLPDQEWVYWCWDDRYPLILDVPMYEKVMADLKGDGLLLIKDPKWNRKGNARSVINCGGYTFIKRRTYSQLAQHQFMRAGTLRGIFSRFPDKIGVSHDMDAMKSDLTMTDRLYVCASDMVFAESGYGGKLYSNTAQMMRDKGYDISDFDVLPLTRIMGQKTWQKYGQS